MGDTDTAAAPVADLSLDQLISQADAPTTGQVQVDAGNTDTGIPATETAQGTTETAAAQGDDTQDETEKPQQPETDSLEVRRARKILEAATAKERSARTAVENAHKELAAQLKANPNGTLAKLGLSLDELIDAGIVEPAGKTAPAKEEDSAIAELRRELNELKADRQNAQIEAAKSNIRSQLTANPGFAKINQSKSQDLVFEFMEGYYTQHGQAVSWDKAAQIVEKDLRARFGPPIAVQGKANPQSNATAPSKPAANKPNGAQASNAAEPATTLTNGNVRTSVPDNADPEDPDELIKVLVAAAERDKAQRQAQQ